MSGLVNFSIQCPWGSVPVAVTPDSPKDPKKDSSNITLGAVACKVGSLGASFISFALSSPSKEVDQTSVQAKSTEAMRFMARVALADLAVRACLYVACPGLAFTVGVVALTALAMAS